MKKLLLGLLGLALVLPVTAKSEEFTDAQKAEIKKMFDEYLMNSGETILQSVNKYQAEIAEKDRLEANKKAIEFSERLEKAKDEDLAITGNPDGDVVMVEFFDYNCGYCRRALEEIQKVLENDDDLKVVFMDMPILGPASVLAAKWSLAAKEQGKYFEYHQALLNHNGQKDVKTLEKIAKDVGLDVKKLKKDANSKEVQKTIDENLAQAQSLGIRGTPGFVLAGQIFPGFMEAGKIKEVIKEARAK